MKSCSRCGKIHEHGKRCYLNARNYYQGDPEIRKFRNSTAWKKKSSYIKEASKYLCAVCFEQNIYNYKDLEVHHIVKLADDMSKSLDDDNLICLCKEHHKLAEENKIPKEKLYELVKKRVQENGN